MAGLDTNKISNIIGTRIPLWLLNQLEERSRQNTRDNRLGSNGETDNLSFLANKTAWVRLVSSVDITNKSDIIYFQSLTGTSIKNWSDLAKEFVLFGGTSKYLSGNTPLSNSKFFSYTQRAGLGQGGSYGMLGEEEIKRYGYRPMPGISSVNIETLGRLGSLRQATINFKCWDKMQLDIIDALYFKLGFTMFLEWGNTFFYSTTGKNAGKLLSSELYSIDPFKENLTKEEINIQISRNIEASEGNYDGMLGLVTNFNFQYNQDGGYDCSLKLTGLGILSDSTKINNPGTLANLLAEEIELYNNTLTNIDRLLSTDPALASVAQGYNPAAVAAQFESLNAPSTFTNTTVVNEANRQQTIASSPQNAAFSNAATAQNLPSLSTAINLENYIKTNVKYSETLKSYVGGKLIYPSTATLNFDKADISTVTADAGGILIIRNLGVAVPLNEDSLIGATVELNYDRISKVLSDAGIDLKAQNGRGSFVNWSNVSFETGATAEGNFTYKNPNISSVSYEIKLAYDENARSNNPNAVFSIPINEFVDVFTNVLKNNDNNKKGLYSLLKVSVDDSARVSKFTVSFIVPFEKEVEVGGKRTKITVASQVKFIFTDSSFIKAIKIPKFNQIGQKQVVPKEEEPTTGQNASLIQIAKSLSSQSGLELVLRTIQVHALTRALQKTKNKDINKVVYTLSMVDDITDSGKPFYQQIFTNGIFSPHIVDLVNGDIKDDVYTTKTAMNPTDRFRIQAKYGFATELMSGRVDISKFQDLDVKYKELLKAFVVPYDISQEITKGTSTNHPVYISLGLLLMLLNHNCTVYEPKDIKLQTPLVYIDFNPNLNFFLSTKKHLSTNPWVTLIPFEGSFEDYKNLFPSEILEQTDGKYYITPVSGSNEKTPLFNPQEEDALSTQIPSLKFDPNNPCSAYKGRLMNVLINIDYIIDSIKNYTDSDSLNSVYLKPFIEVVLSDINKYLGNFNVLRMSYNDGANTYQIVDDQILPPGVNENLLEPTNQTALPLIGKNNIAKSLYIKTDISSKLANMLAISANTNATEKAMISVDGSPVGFVNTAYRDRYIPRKGELTGSISNGLDSVKTTAMQFNASVSDFYSTINPSQDNVSQASGYYIDRMVKKKNEDFPTRASSPIPLSVNFSIDGVSGFNMGQGFTIPSELIPYTYNARSIQQETGLGPNHINKVGFLVFGLNHSIENNQWTTTIRGNMTYLKYATEFSSSAIQPSQNPPQFRESPYNQYPSVERETPAGLEDKIKIVKTFFEQKGYSPVQISAIIGALIQESNINPKAENKLGAFGIAQWLDRRPKLQQKIAYDTLEVQLAFMIEEFNGSESIAGSKLKAALTLEEAIVAMALYERYKGVTTASTYQDLLTAPETGNRIGYAKYIFNNYNNI